MRRILVDYARAGAAVKPPSRQDRVEMSNVLALVRERSAEFIALDQALERLASWDERQAKIVELRFYCGTHRGGNRGRFRHLGKDRQARLEFGARLACQGKVESSAFEQSIKFRF
jgi:hypothetical protein